MSVIRLQGGFAQLVPGLCLTTAGDAAPGAVTIDGATALNQCACAVYSEIMKAVLRNVLIAILSICLLSCGGGGARMIVLIIIDTLRADHLGCYGYDAIETPNIDRLAAEGTLYEKAITAVPVTLPSISTILTGAYPAQHGLRDNGPYQLSDEWETLAETLQQAGFVTGAFVSATVLSRDHNLAQGFDVYDDDMSPPYVPYHQEMIEIKEQFQGIERRAGVTVDRAIGWLRKLPRRDAFLMVHLFDPHVPRDPPPPFNETYEGRFYDGEIAYTDHELGRLFDALRKLEGRSQVLTVLVADHGEGLGDHGEQFHGDLLFDETVRVPLILHERGVSRGNRVGRLVRTIDIAPTICAAAGVEPPPWTIGAPLPASDADVTELNGRVDYLETFRPRLSRNWCELRGLRTEQWKLVDGPKLQLYDLSVDDGERSDVADTHPAIRDSLVQLMNTTALGSVHHGSHFAEALELSQEQRKKLESLGYITPKGTRTANTDTLAVWYFPPKERGAALGLPDPRDKVEASYHRIVAESYYSAAQSALEAGDFTTAAQRFGMAIRNKRDFPEAYLGMAEVARRVRRNDIATKYLREAREVMPHNVAIIDALADVLTQSGHVDSALAVVEEALDAGVTDSTLMARRAFLRRRAGTR
jgi:arylsulfatase A-like enzyme